MTPFDPLFPISDACPQPALRLMSARELAPATMTLRDNKKVLRPSRKSWLSSSYFFKHHGAEVESRGCSGVHGLDLNPVGEL
jgi:hypothetical protein